MESHKFSNFTADIGRLITISFKSDGIEGMPALFRYSAILICSREGCQNCQEMWEMHLVAKSELNNLWMNGERSGTRRQENECLKVHTMCLRKVMFRLALPRKCWYYLFDNIFRYYCRYFYKKILLIVHSRVQSNTSYSIVLLLNL